ACTATMVELLILHAAAFFTWNYATVKGDAHDVNSLGPPQSTSNGRSAVYQARRRKRRTVRCSDMLWHNCDRQCVFRSTEQTSRVAPARAFTVDGRRSLVPELSIGISHGTCFA